MDPTLAAWLAVADSSDDEFVDRLWRLVLRREVGPEVRDDVRARLEGGLSRSALLLELATSPEFEHVRILDDSVAWAAAQRRSATRPRNLHAPPATDERPIEIPWCLARCPSEARILDVGYAFAEPAYLAGLLGLGASITGVDLVAIDVPGLTSVQADVRRLPFPRGSFDTVIAISTLEHVGRDNEVYEIDAAREEEGDEAALRELRRVLAKDGRLIVSVPTGERDDQGWQLQRTPDDWIAVFEGAGFLVYEDELYVGSADDGWRSATLEETRDARYGESGPGAGAVLLAELHPETVGGKLRLVVRDVRHGDAPRRSTHK
jgi:SAM-dependent methyltransferase